MKDILLNVKYNHGLVENEKGELCKILSLTQPPCNVLELNDDEMEIIIECPNCHKPTKVGEIRMISSYVGCDNKLSDGRVCYWDDLIPRIRSVYKYEN